MVRGCACEFSRNSRVAALVGDLATENDAARLRSSGAPVKQITTGTIRHLDATMGAGMDELLRFLGSRPAHLEASQAV